MRINDSGNVGIGNTTPRGLLHVGTTAAATDIPVPTGNFAIVRAGSYGLASVAGIQLSGGYGDSGRVGAWQVKAVGANEAGSFVNNLLFTTQNSFSGSETERMRIDASGNVGIGASSPVTRLEVNGGLIAGAENRQTHPNASALGGFKAQWNFSGGNAETNFYNLFNGASESFRFYQSTGSGTAQLLYSMQPSTHQLYTGGSERMRIDSSGKVGIGTSSPTDLLTVSDGSIASTISGSGANIQMGRIAMYSSALGAAYTNYGGEIRSFSGAGIDVSDLRFYTANTAATTERMRIGSSGTVSIGTTALLASLTVSGAGGSGQVAGFRNALYLRHSSSSGNQSNFIVFGSAGTVSSCFIGNDIQADGTTINRLDAQAGGSGGVFLGSGATSWASASDERGKDIIEPILNAVQKVNTLRAVIGKYKTDAEGTRRSFLIAQDVQAVLPEAVNVGTDDQQTLSVAYTDTIPLLIAAIKELTARVAQLEGN
jgi:hypothetical protein